MNHSTLMTGHRWTSSPLAMALLSMASLSACSPAATTTPTTASATIGAASSVAAAQPPNVAALSATCASAFEVLGTCAHETSCTADITMFLPSAARSQWLAASQTPGFSEEAFDRYCEAACRRKSSAIDQAAFAAEVCVHNSATADKSAAMPAATALKEGLISIFLMKDLSVSTEPIPISKIHQALGTPLKTDKSPHECDSAYDAEDIKLLTYAHAAFESDGKTAVLRWADIGPSAGTVDFGTKVQSTALSSFDTIKTSSGFKPMEIDATTLRLPTRQGASLEKAYDLKFNKDQLTRIELWIGC